MKNKTIAAILISLMVIGSLSGYGAESNDAVETTAQVETAGEDEKESAEAEVAAKAAEEAEAARKAEEEAAAAKEAEANEYYEAGRTCLYGTDEMKIDLESAYNNFEKAKELGKTEANFYLGKLCELYSYPEKNYEMAKTYYESCEDNPYAQVALALLDCEGQGVEEDKEKAKELCQSVIEQGYAEGYIGIAEVLYNEEEYAEAFENYTKALEGTEEILIAYAMDWIGYLYYCGDGVEQDYAKAMEWFKKAADLGNPCAMDDLAYLYYSGEGVEQDYEKALEWFEKAAELGNEIAKENAEDVRQLLQQ